MSAVTVDPYLKPSLSWSSKLRRAFWGVFYVLLFRPSPRSFFRWRTWLLKCFGAKIHKSCYIYPKAIIWAPWLLEIGDVATIADGVEVYNPGGISLGHHCIVSQGAFLCGATHNPDDPTFPFIAKRIELGAYSWVCARAVVLPGVTLGDGAVLGAASVATRSLDPWTIHAGNPARLIRARKRQG